MPAHAEKHAVVLLSGGIDSAVTLAIAQQWGFVCHALTIDYRQRHHAELAAAAAVAKQLRCASHKVLALDLRAIGGSALTGETPVPKDRPEAQLAGHIPVTYVPARNLVFLSLAAGFAETLDAADLFVGINAVDYSGYPDCRPEFITSLTGTLNLATRQGTGAGPGSPAGRPWTIHTPLVALNKAQIIARGYELGVNLALTHSCYDPAPGGAACRHCDSCLIRARGFAQAGVADPTRYA